MKTRAATLWTSGIYLASPHKNHLSLHSFLYIVTPSPQNIIAPRIITFPMTPISTRCILCNALKRRFEIIKQLIYLHSHSYEYIFWYTYMDERCIRHPIKVGKCSGHRVAIKESSSMKSSNSKCLMTLTGLFQYVVSYFVAFVAKPRLSFTSHKRRCLCISLAAIG